MRSQPSGAQSNNRSSVNRCLGAAQWSQAFRRKTVGRRSLTPAPGVHGPPPERQTSKNPAQSTQALTTQALTVTTPEVAGGQRSRGPNIKHLGDAHRTRLVVNICPVLHEHLDDLAVASTSQFSECWRCSSVHPPIADKFEKMPNRKQLVRTQHCPLLL